MSIHAVAVHDPEHPEVLHGSEIFLNEVTVLVHLSKLRDESCSSLESYLLNNITRLLGDWHFSNILKLVVSRWFEYLQRTLNLIEWFVPEMLLCDCHNVLLLLLQNRKLTSFFWNLRALTAWKLCFVLARPLLNLLNLKFEHRILLLNRVIFLTYIFIWSPSGLNVKLILISRKKRECTSYLSLVLLLLTLSKTFFVWTFSIINVVIAL
jgi:hypothetical protein